MNRIIDTTPRRAMTTAQQTQARTLAEKTQPEKTALVVVDYQNDFVAEGGALSKAGKSNEPLAAIQGELSEAIDLAHHAGARVVFLKCEYSTSDNRFLSRVFLDQARRRLEGLYHKIPVCEPGSWGSEFYGDVQPIGTDLVVKKHRFGGFDGTDLDMVLRSNGIESLVFTGVVTHVCVESTVREAFFHDYFNIVLGDVVAGYRQDWHEHSLQLMDWGFGEVVDLDDLRSVWA
ncbi:MAG: isochorismatase family protein [Acidimicrobiia bacterium]|nr:isochorismatase family protein [Acidimicrobiia bacterium]